MRVNPKRKGVLYCKLWGAPDAHQLKADADYAAKLARQAVAREADKAMRAERWERRQAAMRAAS